MLQHGLFVKHFNSEQFFVFEAEFLEIVSAPSNLIPLALQSKCRLEMIKLLLQG